jgi:hypothetical protein
MCRLSLREFSVFLALNRDSRYFRGAKGDFNGSCMPGGRVRDIVEYQNLASGQDKHNNGPITWGFGVHKSLIGTFRQGNCVDPS